MIEIHRAEHSAFTLIELLIVVAIIAILAAIAVPNFLEAQTRAKASRSHADMRALATAIESYHTDYDYYPLNGVLLADGSIQNPQNNGVGSPVHKFLTEGVTTPVAYVTRNYDDPFIRPLAGMPDSWMPYYPRYFYTNFDWYSKIMEPNPLPVIAVKKGIYGVWVLAGAGPDGDRLDLSKDLYYDPTNGTISDGDIVHSLKIITK